MTPGNRPVGRVVARRSGLAFEPFPFRMDNDIRDPIV